MLCYAKGVSYILTKKYTKGIQKYLTLSWFTFFQTKVWIEGLRNYSRPSRHLHVQS